MHVRHLPSVAKWRLVLALTVLLFPSSLSAQTASASEALSLQQQGKWAEAAQAWRAVTQQNPNDAGAFASLGVALSRQQKYREAVQAYKKAIQLNPGLRGIHLNWGLAEFKQGHFREAVPPLKVALAAEPRSLQASALLGMSYYGSKRFAEAAKYLEVAAKADPDNSELHQLLAQSCLWSKKYSCAREQFREILERDPNSAAAHILLGEALDGLGRSDEAIAELQAAAKASPQAPNVYFGLGYLYWKQHNFDDAERAFERQLSIDPIHAQSLAYLGDIAMKRSQPQKALPLLRKAIKERNDLRFAYVDLGAVLTDLKQYKEAIAALEQAVKMDPSQPDAHYRLARVYREMGDEDKAKKEFIEVRNLHPKAEEDLTPKMSESPPALKQ
jgi:tetratricopeptide (TPR) repeat protein